MVKKIFLRVAVALVILGGTAALYVTVSSRTPLPAHALVAGPTTVDLAAYRAGELQFPGESWERVEPALLGFRHPAILLLSHPRSLGTSPRRPPVGLTCPENPLTVVGSIHDERFGDGPGGIRLQGRSHLEGDETWDDPW